MESESIEQASSAPGGRGAGETARGVAAISGDGRPSTAAGDARAGSSEGDVRHVANPVPDWCNIGITLRVVVGVNTVVFAIAALQSNDWPQFLGLAVELAATAEPVLLASLLLGCPVRRATAGWPAPAQIALALLLPAVLTYGWQYFLQTGLDFAQPRIASHAVSAGLLSAGVLYWTHLRTLAFSPALAQARLQALQSRIRPHFLFNSLNAVLGLIRSDPRRAETAIEDLADLFRVLMRDSRERVPLRDEVALCRQYLAIETLRLGERLRADWQIDERAMNALVPTLLLQPLIENAVLHGIEPAPGGGTIAIRIAVEGAYVDIVISNPLSVPRARGGVHSGIGLDNVRQRLALVHDLEARLEISARDGRFEVRIQLPIETGPVRSSPGGALSVGQRGLGVSRESGASSAATQTRKG